MFIALNAELLAKGNVSLKIRSVSLTSKTPKAFLGPCVIIKCEIFPFSFEGDSNVFLVHFWRSPTSLCLGHVHMEAFAHPVLSLCASFHFLSVDFESSLSFSGFFFSHLQRMQKRAERFNVPVSLESKKAARAARWVPHPHLAQTAVVLLWCGSFSLEISEELLLGVTVVVPLASNTLLLSTSLTEERLKKSIWRKNSCCAYLKTWCVRHPPRVCLGLSPSSVYFLQVWFGHSFDKRWEGEAEPIHGVTLLQIFIYSWERKSCWWGCLCFTICPRPGFLSRSCRVGMESMWKVLWVGKADLGMKFGGSSLSEWYGNWEKWDSSSSPVGGQSGVCFQRCCDFTAPLFR